MSDSDRLPDPATRTEGEGDTLDMPEELGAFSNGQILGERYQILEMLGRGGMGEVWHALDLKLRVEVALKALRLEFFKSERRLELLRQEVRAAREVVSPNVCRIFDLVEVEGRELVSMEHVDGATLLGVLQERGPLELKEAQDIASQFLAGLEAIHKAGLIHRDIKPENIMLTRAGRVVVMDFGLARQETEGGGTVAGTPAYMAPEQAAGQTLDARADVYAAGVVLAEMVSPDGITNIQSRQSVWEGVRSEPAHVPDVPWAPVIKRAVKKDRDQRFNSAHTLIRALEDVTLRVEGAEDLHPYPGLASFTEEDAEYFFGREAEIEQMWRRLDRPHLLAVAGPSGSGKTSFLRAGLASGAPPGWRIGRCTPGNTPFTALRELLASELSGDANAMRLLVKGDDADALVEAFSGWRQRHSQAILMVDQFEELFTLNPLDVQRAFAELLRRLVLEADVFVLLSVRDDFLARCREHEAFASVFSDLTVLLAPAGAALRRALTQPALQCGYRFEDDELVEEMLAEVEGERGALPLLAFALSRLWENRDRETGLLTRRAYHDIGGVGGALAQHAETTIDRIGSENLATVRELFRNLVTAEGTRAVREWNELLSVFGSESTSLSSRASEASRGTPPLQEGDDRGAPSRTGGDPSTRSSNSLAQDDRRSSAEEVLRELIDARLLTSYEVRDEDREPTRRVEIIHESLLANWPRLVRWQTQDADAAQLRDQLRQAARTWDEHGRTEDTLWTGAAYREYASWRERYPGGLTELEESFGSAMTRHADRRRRRRRAAMVATLVVLVGVLVTIGGFWRNAVSEARRADAATLFSLAQLELEGHPTAAIAYAIGSLELADNPEVRRLALHALWMGPTEFRLETNAPWIGSLDFSPDGRWLATVDPAGKNASLWPSDGGPPTALEGHEFGGELRVSQRGDLVAATMEKKRQKLGLWTIPDGSFLRSFDMGDTGETYVFQVSPDGERLLTNTSIPVHEGYAWVIRSWPISGGEARTLARIEVPEESGMAWSVPDRSWRHHAWADGREVHIARVEEERIDLASTTSVEHDRAIVFLAFDGEGRLLATTDGTGTFRVWSLERDPPRLTRTLKGYGGTGAMNGFNRTGSMLAGSGGLLWDLNAPPNTEPLRLKHTNPLVYGFAFAPDGRWLATSAQPEVSLWPLGRTYPLILKGHEDYVMRLVFTPDGQRLASTSEDGSVRLWPLDGSSVEQPRVLGRGEGSWLLQGRMAMAPDGSFVATGDHAGLVRVFPLDGDPFFELTGLVDRITAVAVGPRARLVAAGTHTGLVRIWDLETEEARDLDLKEGGIGVLEFTGDGDLWVATPSKLQRWNLDHERPRTEEEIDLEDPSFVGGQNMNPTSLDLTHRKTLRRDGDRLWIQDLDTHESLELRSYGSDTSCGLSASGRIVWSNDGLGTIRVGLATGGEPHLLLGPEQGSPVVSPDGRWIATWGQDSEIRLWPMPDLSKPPLHTLPRGELIAKLKSLTNLRVVPDPESVTGWKIDVGPFPGWETVPTW
jgi:WD40 repeat protein